MRVNYTVNCSILLTDVPLLHRPQAAREAGFDAVEFWWPFDSPTPPDREVDSFVRAIEDAGVQLTGLNFAAGDMTAGERGLLSDPAHRSAFNDNVDVVIGIGERLQTTGFNALYGNRHEELTFREQDEIAIENLARAGRAAERIGAVVLVEPLSGIPRYPLKRAKDVVDVLDRVQSSTGVTSLRLLADMYHLVTNGDDIDTTVELYGDRIGHVQIADSPGRGAPGTGIVDLDRHLATLVRRGYRGFVSLEYISNSSDPFEWLPHQVRRSDRADDCAERRSRRSGSPTAECS
ncbi:hydroxypyruvate isomerase [Rhodococcus sp. 27YEA15]|uniref:hydroxypyruvate isomerase family protein n=1 Tax=Rhodococcus sp. 27YEA15 TaxID=3156259 RepID=UPI003C7D20D1